MTDNYPTPSFGEMLSTYREELDALDEQLVSLLAKRFAVTHKVGELKAAHAAAPLDPVREAEQMARFVELSRQYGLPGNTTQAIFETIIGLVRENHREIAQGY